MRWLPILSMFALLLWPAGRATAQIVYRDSEGVSHFVDSLDQVPEKYRGRAIGRPPTPAPAKQSPRARGDAGPHVLWESVNGRTPRAKIRTFSTANECLAGMDNYDQQEQQTLTALGGSYVLGGQLITSIGYVCVPLGVTPE